MARKAKRYTLTLSGKPEEVIKARIAWKAYSEYMQLAGKRPLRELTKYMQSQVKQIAALLEQQDEQQKVGGQQQQ